MSPEGLAGGWDLSLGQGRAGSEMQGVQPHTRTGVQPQELAGASGSLAGPFAHVTIAPSRAFLEIEGFSPFPGSAWESCQDLD